jgi:hypothetical protein
MAIENLLTDWTPIVTTSTNTLFKSEYGACLVSSSDSDTEGYTLKQGEMVILGPNLNVKAKIHSGVSATLSYIKINEAAPHGPSMVTTVTGTFIATGNSSNFKPIAGRSFNITISNIFNAILILERSFDNGQTWFPLTANGIPILTFSSPVSEQWGDEEYNVVYRLSCTQYVSGTVNYRISQ